jgi:dTDP-6-deoxy-L-talose 4-dehydrogenase (NAD+)
MKILVTGATGFVGNHLIKQLLRYNHEIIATGFKQKENLNYHWVNKVKYIQCNLNEPIEDNYNFFYKPDMLIHLYWEGLPNYKELFHFEKNLFNSYFFIKDLVKGGIKELIVLGTCLEYGIKEGMLSEEVEPKPILAYALAKDTLRKFIAELTNRNKNVNFKWIRMFYLFGEGQNRNSLLEQLKIAIQNKEKSFNMSGGEQLRDYLPIEKAVDYICKIAFQKTTTGIINCCSGKPISVKQLVTDYLQQNNIDIKLNFGYYSYPDYEPMAFWGDIRKLNNLLLPPNNY